MAGISRELPFVDRDHELSLLKRLLDETSAGKGQVVFVAGEGGVGKTTLLRELGSYAKSHGIIFAVGHSYEEESLIPYSPWIEAIRTVTQQSSVKLFSKTLGRTIAEVGRLVPELAEKAKGLGIKGWLSGPEESFALVTSADAERIRLFQAVTDFLIYVSRNKPLLLFFDDILWADVASLRLLHYFSRRIREEKIMVSAAYRDVELPEEHTLYRLILDLNRERILRRIMLNRFPIEHVTQLISNHLGSGPVAPEFGELIRSRTGGNPFFVEEVLRSLIEEGKIFKSENGWTLQEIGQVNIPATVRSLLRQRISRLDPETVQTLTFGSAVGMEFGYELLQTITTLEEDKLVGQLESGVRAGLIKEQRSGKEASYLFSDDQIRDYLYDELSLIRKRKTHACIATSMEKLYENKKNAHLEELAHHYVQAGEAAKATEYSKMAGNRALSVHAYREAKNHYRNLLDLLDEGQWVERLDGLTGLGEASFRIGEYEETVRYLTEAVSIARRLNQNTRGAQLSSRLGYVHWLFGNDREKALESYKEGLMILGEGDTVEHAAIQQSIARLLVNSGEVEEGLRYCGDALRIARKFSAQEVLAHSLNTIALGTRPSQKAQIFNYLEDALRISLDNGLEDPACRSYENIGLACRLVTAEYAKAKENHLKAIEYARRVGYLHYEAWLTCGLALYGHIPLGEWDDAFRVATLSNRLSQELGEVHIGRSLIALGLVHLFRGNTDRAEECLRQAYFMGKRSYAAEFIYFASLALGTLYTKTNTPEKAEEYLLSGAEAGSHFAVTTPPVEIYFLLVKVYLMTGRVDDAQKFYERVRNGAEALGERWAQAYERWASALLAVVRKDWSEAKAAFKKSNELWSELQHPYHYALTLQSLSETLAMRGETEEASRLKEDAYRILVRLGAKLDLSRPKRAF